jgi:hypothetical protein
MKEGGCPFTKMCKLAGTPHVGAILIVLFVIAGAGYFWFLNMRTDYNKAVNVEYATEVRNEEGEIENALKQLPRGI